MDLLQYYGSATSKLSGEVVNTFDFISIQLYESYSHAVYNVSVLATSPAVYLENFVRLVLEGWEVDYSVYPAPPGHLNPPMKHTVQILASQLVIGTVLNVSNARLSCINILYLHCHNIQVSQTGGLMAQKHFAFGLRRQLQLIPPLVMFLPHCSPEDSCFGILLMRVWYLLVLRRRCGWRVV